MPLMSDTVCFGLVIYSEPRNLLTNQTYLDISEYTQKNEYGYYVTVEAQAKGSELRSSSQEITFSYNENESSDVTCGFKRIQLTNNSSFDSICKDTTLNLKLK